MTEDSTEIEYTTKGNPYAMTKAKAEEMFQLHGQESFDLYKTWDFPIPSYEDRFMLSEINSLKTKQSGDKTNSKMIRNFHPSIWKCSRGNMMSPFDYWNHFKTESIDCWKKFYINRLRNACTSLSDKFRKDGIMRAETIRDGFTITHAADCPSYLKPMLAKRLCKTYLNDFETIFCPMNGFSGIMLGVTLGCGKNYIGQDLNQTSIDEAKALLDFIKPHLNANTSVVLRQMDMFLDPNHEYDCMLVCPPYADIEKWNFDENGNCIDKNLTCDQWIDELITQYKCKKYVIVVDNNISKYKSNVVETLNNRSHFGSNSEHIVVIEK